VKNILTQQLQHSLLSPGEMVDTLGYRPTARFGLELPLSPCKVRCGIPDKFARHFQVRSQVSAILIRDGLGCSAAPYYKEQNEDIPRCSHGKQYVKQPASQGAQTARACLAAKAAIAQVHSVSVFLADDAGI